MSLNISIHDDISIAELLKIHEEHGVVLKTPHVGNIYPNNLAIASLGIPTLFYDRTLGRKDLNFHPHQLIVDAHAEVIADPDILTTHSVVNRVPNNMLSAPPIGLNLVDFHMSAVKNALPDANCFTYTDYIQRNAEGALEVLEIATDQNAHLWTRQVDEKGGVTRIKAKDWKDIINTGIYGLTNSKSGWLIPNPISILFHNTIDIARNAVEDVYLLSGPEMYKYISGYQEELSAIYERVKMRSSLKLPETVICHVIPVIDMRFLVEKAYKDALDELIDSYLGEIGMKESLICLEKNIHAFQKTIFYNIEVARCFTQHDLLKSNGLYIHPWALNTKLCDVSIAFRLLKRYYMSAMDQLQEEL